MTRPSVLLVGAYRFTVAVAHPWLGLLFAYAGRLRRI
ncbi:MAG: DUF4166 domain-containing protein [Pseudomonadota bacterium]